MTTRGKTTFHAYPCEDCGARFVGTEMAHKPTCPLALVADAGSESDRDWFAAHPAATEYWRPLDQYDKDTIRRSQPVELPEGEWAGKVRVVQIEPGLRTRRYDRIFFVVAGLGSLS